MKLYYDEKDIEITQYDDNKSSVELNELKSGSITHIFSDTHQIVFIVKGTGTISCNTITDKMVKAGESVLIPKKNPCVFKTSKNASILILKLSNRINLHNHLPKHLLITNRKKTKSYSIGFLKQNQRVKEFVNTVINYLNDGIKSLRFYDVKIQEFLFIVKAYYEHKQVMDFFIPIFSKDFMFSNDISLNLDKAKTVKDLALLLDYSLSGFEKKFKRVYEISPYQWMLEQKAKKIYHEICFTKKTFTTLADEYGFSSPAHLNDFCRNHFNSTPGVLRKKSKQV